MEISSGGMRWRLVGVGVTLLVLGSVVLVGLGRLHESRRHYGAHKDAAADLSMTVTQLGALKWEVMAEGDAEADETAEAAALSAAGDRHVATMLELQPGGHQMDLRAAGGRFADTIASRRRVGQEADLLSVWRQYSAGVSRVIDLVETGNPEAADSYEENTVEQTEVLLLELVGRLRADSARMDARADRMQVTGALVLTGSALLASMAALTLAQRRRRLTAVAAVLRRGRDALRHQATHDGLTGLANRALFIEGIAEHAARHRRTGAGFAVLLVDLDHFKEINDTLGHRTGDEMLQAVSERLRHAIRDDDVVARLGGDEFAVLMADTVDETEPTRLAKRILDALAVPVDLNGISLTIEASLGIAVFPLHGDDHEGLLHRADVAMYQAKVHRNAFSLYAPAHDRTDSAKLQLLSDLRHTLAADDGQLSLAYQPQVDLTTGEVRAVEALLRWDHPIDGLIPPDVFIPMAEQTQLIDTLTWFVLDSALRQLTAWDEQGLHLTVAVNVSVRNVMDERLPAKISELLERHHVAAERLEIEITETLMLTDPGRVARVLHRLRGIGVRVAMDDYGTGYSSLGILRQLPIDVIKIDRSLIANMSNSASDRAIVASTIDLARHLGLEVVAEGVETSEELRMLADRRCHAIQGYLVSRPVSGSDLPGVVRNLRPAAGHATQVMTERMPAVASVH